MSRNAQLPSVACSALWGISIVGGLAAPWWPGGQQGPPEFHVFSFIVSKQGCCFPSHLTKILNFSLIGPSCFIWHKSLWPRRMDLRIRAKHDGRGAEQILRRQLQSPNPSYSILKLIWGLNMWKVLSGCLADKCEIHMCVCVTRDLETELKIEVYSPI